MSERAMTSPAMTSTDAAVRERYEAGARVRENGLCCPASYDPGYLEPIPQEIQERDYGCGDPSRHVRPGDVVLDLGSGSGKVCFIASQIVGADGRVIGVDENREMLALARHHQQAIGDSIGWHNVEFYRARIQDLTLDLDRIDGWLREHPVGSVDELAAFEAHRAWQRRTRPLVPDGSVDVVISNCVLNLVNDADKPAVLREAYRVLKSGGRMAISDIVSDEEVPMALKANPKLWSGCVSGAMREDRLLAAFEESGFHGITIDKFDSEPWRVVEGIEFRSITVLAWKGKVGPCKDYGDAVVYLGPFRSVTDDNGHVMRRGERTAVCDKTFDLLMRSPYGGHFAALPSQAPPPEGEAPDFDCRRSTRREPSETKGSWNRRTVAPNGGCGPGCC